MQSEPYPEPETQSQESEAATDMESLLDEHLEEQEDYVGRRGDIREGRVIEVTEDGALVNIGLKREGFVASRDLRQMRRAHMGEVEVGQTVPVMILSGQNAEGYLDVSIYRALLEVDWLKAEKLLAGGEIHEAEISGYNRGGLTIKFGRIRGFIPMSHIVGLPRGLKDPERRERLAAMVGQTVGLRVIEVDRQRRRLILSQRQAFRAWQRLRKRQLLEELEEGQRRQGVVTSITGFGAFVDLGGIDGLVHVSELSWQRVDDPRQVVQVGDEVEVVVLEVDRGRQRIGLSIKQTQGDPWDQVGSKYKVNQLVEGRVTRVTDIGAFVELEPGVEGLLHVSELVGAPSVTPQEVLHAGDEVLLKVLRVEPSRHRVGLSARRVRREEWERWAAEKAAAEAEEAEVEEAAAVPLPEVEGESPAAELAPDVEAEPPAAEPLPEVEGEPPAAEPLPEVEGEPPAAEPLPEVEGEPPAAELPPDVEVEPPATEPLPDVEAEPPAAGPEVSPEAAAGEESAAEEAASTAEVASSVAEAEASAEAAGEEETAEEPTSAEESSVSVE